GRPPLAGEEHRQHLDHAEREQQADGGEQGHQYPRPALLSLAPPCRLPEDPNRALRKGLSGGACAIAISRFAFASSLPGSSRTAFWSSTIARPTEDSLRTPAEASTSSRTPSRFAAAEARSPS